MRHRTTRIEKARAKARVPFLNQLAREFDRDKAHVFRVCIGTSTSPLRVRILARQAELLREAALKRQNETPAPAAPGPTSA